MDWGTVAASVATSLVSGGVMGAIAAVWVGRKESDDRQAALALDREKWDHERQQPDWAKEDEAYDALQAMSDRITDYANELERDGITDPRAHDDRMIAILREASKALTQVQLHGSPYVHHVALSAVNTFKGWVGAFQTDHPAKEEMRQRLAFDQRTVIRSIKSRLEKRRQTSASDG